MTSRLASCSCGKLTAQVKVDPIRVSVCHCLACQRRTGSVFGAQARFATQSVTIKGQGTEFVRVGDECSSITFTFCSDCGATVFYKAEDRPEMIAIPVGAFADPTFPGPSFSVYEERMHTWVTMPRDIDHMP